MPTAACKNQLYLHQVLLMGRRRLLIRRGAGVVERGGLENRCARKRTQGSNPCLSAIALYNYYLNQWLKISYQISAILSAILYAMSQRFFPIPNRIASRDQGAQHVRSGQWHLLSLNRLLDRAI